MSIKNAKTFTMDGKNIEFLPGQSVAEALFSNGITLLRKTIKGQGRGVFCGMGICGECRVIVEGVPNICSCQEQASEGLSVQTQLDAELGGQV